jgi:hypothetical protein
LYYKPDLKNEQAICRQPGLCYNNLNKGSEAKIYSGSAYGQSRCSR